MRSIRFIEDVRSSLETLVNGAASGPKCKECVGRSARRRGRDRSSCLPTLSDVDGSGSSFSARDGTHAESIGGEGTAQSG